MNSPKMLTKAPTPNGDLAGRLKQLGLIVTSEVLDDLLARASTQRWSPRQLIEEVTRSEAEDRARRSLERRLVQARLGHFKPMADFEWHWPKKIDHALIDRAFSLDFLSPGCNLILCGSNGARQDSGVTANVVWYSVKRCAKLAGIDHLSPHDLRRSCARLCHLHGGELEQIQFLLGHSSVQTTERYIGCKQNLRDAVNDRFEISVVRHAA